MKASAAHLLVILVCVGLVACADSPEKSSVALGGFWDLESITYYPIGGSQIETRLYHRNNGKRVFVAERVWQQRYYPNDCVAFHSSGHGLNGYFAACGDRQPLLLSDSLGDWRFEDQTIDKLGYRDGENGKVVVQQLRVADVIRAAKAQPPFRPEAMSSDTPD